MAWINNVEPTVPVVDAVAVAAVMGTGRSKPVQMRCQGPAGATDYIVKLQNTPELALGVHCLAREMYGALLANWFGLVTPDVAVVIVDPELGTTVIDIELRERIRMSAGQNFGSKYLAGAAVFVPPPTMAKTNVAIRIFCFDMLIGNVDRNMRKPNMFDAGEDYVLIDHEQAFPYSRPGMWIGGAPPAWELIKEPWHEQHVVFAGLKGQNCRAGIAAFVGILSTLPDEVFATIEEKIPAEWRGPDVQAITDYLKNARGNVKSVQRSLQEVLV